MARPEGGYIKDGVRVVSVTEALSMTRLRRWAGNPADWDRRRIIGSAVHQVCAILDCNQSTWDTCPDEWVEEYAAVSTEVEGMVRAWEKFKLERRFVPRLIEHSFFCKTQITEFATTIDREGMLGLVPAICEIKTPKVKEPYWGVQLAGQELAVLSSLGPPIVRPYNYTLIVVQLSANETYKVTEYDDKVDREVFLWSLGLSVWIRNKYGK